MTNERRIEIIRQAARQLGWYPEDPRTPSSGLLSRLSYQQVMFHLPRLLAEARR